MAVSVLRTLTCTLLPALVWRPFVCRESVWSSSVVVPRRFSVSPLPFAHGLGLRCNETGAGRHPERLYQVPLHGSWPFCKNHSCHMLPGAIQGPHRTPRGESPVAGQDGRFMHSPSGAPSCTGKLLVDPAWQPGCGWQPPHAWTVKLTTSSWPVPVTTM